MNSLFARLSLALLVIVGCMGGAFYWTERTNTRLYYEELTQTLNAPIGMYVTAQRQLIRDGAPDLDSLAELAGRAMVINPSAEVYLLDTEGRILGHGLEDGEVIRQTVDIAPIQRLIDGQVRLPVQGDDPRNLSDRKVFSAAPVVDDGMIVGYLYVILGGARYEAVAGDIGGLYAGRVMAMGAAVIVTTAAILGVLVFGLLTRRLKRLSGRVAELGQYSLDEKWEQPTLAPQEGDEIDRLTAAFTAMSGKIDDQFRQLRENDRLRRELVANISHDLRTPLSAMQGYIETLVLKREQLTAAQQQRYLEIARRHTVRLGSLIGDLFELAKLDSASVTPQVEAFSLSELAHDIVLEFQLEADKRDIALSVRRTSGAGLTRGDIGLIQRVLENLVRNAIRFTPAGGEIVLDIEENTRSVTVAVSDTGPGIPAEDIPHIFDRYFQSEQDEETRADSSGLGLAIVKRILDLHDSTINVISRAEAGTRFEFDLPRYAAAA